VRNLNNHFHIGSCAWSFEDWRGSFYPADLPAGRWLGWYAHVFNAVEIDATFYANPPATTVGRWLAEAPAHFRFTCKAPKAITHELRLRDCDGVLGEFLETMQPLHGHIGAILFQMPPSFTPERDSTALRDFVLGLPHGWRYAIEFRDADWHRPHFVKLLEDHNVCWAWNDMTSVEDQDQAPFGFLPETADFRYVRLMGDPRTKYGAEGERVFAYGKVLWSREQAIESWAVRLHKQAEHVKAVYVMCNNHYEGFAPETCRRIAERLGVGITLPDVGMEERVEKGPRQMKLL
jgi:uncharacterized protein YecE (DUF72 family)